MTIQPSSQCGIILADPVARRNAVREAAILDRTTLYQFSAFAGPARIDLTRRLQNFKIN
jgi:hypothetical protein